VAAGALIAATTLTTVALSADEPDRCCVAGDDGPVAGPSPTAKALSSRAAGLPLCIVGSWRVVDEVLSMKFYTDAPAITFTGNGRQYEFRPDGTATELQVNVTHAATYKGNRLSSVGNGVVEYTWKATASEITYMARTKTTVVYTNYDQRGQIGTSNTEPNNALNEVDQYTCSGNQVIESNPATGYRAVWARTTGFGVYG
jgi:hypothetical protein